MATIKNTTSGEAFKGSLATTHNSASSYGQPVWTDGDGQAYMQVGMQNPFYAVELGIEGQRAELGAAMRDRRKELGLTLAHLSAASGVAVANISKLEQGGTANIDTICKLASAMGCRLALLPE